MATRMSPRRRYTVRLLTNLYGRETAERALGAFPEITKTGWEMLALIRKTTGVPCEGEPCSPMSISYTALAETLGYSRPTVRQQISALERHRILHVGLLRGEDGEWAVNWLTALEPSDWLWSEEDDA